MGRKRGPGDGEPSAFEEAVADATPLADRDKTRPPPRGRRRAPPAAAREDPRLQLEEGGIGRAPDVDGRLLARLRRGEIEVEARVDLHGLREAEARRVVQRDLRRARAGDERCLLVIHGRGKGSAGEPVLKTALVEWLCEPPLASRVLAFAPALPRDGGAGATYVLLRRSR